MSADNLLQRQAQAVLRRQAQAQHVAPAAMLVNEKTAAALLGGICVKSLYNLRRRCGLPFVQLGRNGRDRESRDSAENRLFAPS